MTHEVHQAWLTLREKLPVDGELEEGDVEAAFYAGLLWFFNSMNKHKTKKKRQQAVQEIEAAVRDHFD